MEKYEIPPEEAKRLKELGKEITALPIIKIPKNATSVSEFSRIDQETIERLDEIFWKEIPQMNAGRMLTEVNPVGGAEKAKAVKEIAKKMGYSLGNVMYVGDSITDIQALMLVRQNGGLAVSFNGNSYSVKESDVAVLSGDTIVTSVLAEVFSRLGKEGALGIINEWNHFGLKKYCNVAELRERMFRVFGSIFPQVERVTSGNVDRLIIESSFFRKTVRGEAIGKLG
jgi:energy-converting hydrogenase A subunit R